jgi:hypothetical protein
MNVRTTAAQNVVFNMTVGNRSFAILATRDTMVLHQYTAQHVRQTQVIHVVF